MGRWCTCPHTVIEISSEEFMTDVSKYQNMVTDRTSVRVVSKGGCIMTIMGMAKSDCADCKGEEF